MKGRCINSGQIEAPAIVSRSPVSFYGGVDPRTGVVIEAGHELEGQSITGKVLVFPQGKGSTVGSYIIYGLARNGAAPAAIVNAETEIIIASGVILAGIPCVDHVDIGKIHTGDRVRVDADHEEVTVL